jgi:transposase
LGFNRYDVPRLQQALKSAADKHLFQRVQAVLWVAQGHTISEVAELTGVSVPTVYNWVKLYLRRHHVATLADAPRSGRPLVALQITAPRIRRQLRRNPLRLGYRTTVWSVNLLAEHLRVLQF